MSGMPGSPKERRLFSLRNLQRLVRDVENWYDVLLYHARMRKAVVVHFRNGARIRYIPQFFQVSLFSRHEDPFWFLGRRVEGRDVLDVGASIGDTSIHFARRGAKRVVALEPFPRLYREALLNVELNEIRNIVVLNKALGGKQRTIRIPPDFVGDISNEAYDFKAGQTVEVTTLCSITDEFGMEDAVLKMNCEGCEYEALLGSDEEVLRRFSDVVLCYHRGKSPLDEFMVRMGFDCQTMFDHPVQGTLWFRRKE
jgi:FkbM family methyltransferase